MGNDNDDATNAPDGPVPLIQMEEINNHVLISITRGAVEWTPEAWGAMMMDLVHHLASAYEQTYEMKYSETANKILKAFDRERFDIDRMSANEIEPSEYN